MPAIISKREERAMRSFKIGLSCVCLAIACGASAQPAEVLRLRDKLTGDAAGKAANNPQCKLFTPAEIARFVGEAVGPGTNAAMGSGCQWSSKDGDGDAIVQVVAANYLSEPRLAKGYKPLPDIGAKGHVLPEMGGWKAAAVFGPDAVVVMVSGKGASEAGAVALLQEAAKRRSR